MTIMDPKTGRVSLIMTMCTFIQILKVLGQTLLPGDILYWRKIMINICLELPVFTDVVNIHSLGPLVALIDIHSQFLSLFQY